MPLELPKKLPLRREVDHEIELELGARPSAMYPYRMAPLELEQLRRQLKELIDAGHQTCSKRSKMAHCGAYFVIKIDNVASSYFLSQKKFSPKQARWQDFLAKFNYVLEYKLGTTNMGADALSYKSKLDTMSQASGYLMASLKEGKLEKGAYQGVYDSKWADHPGQKRTLALLEVAYYWPNMRDDVQMYVKTCLVGQNVWLHRLDIATLHKHEIFS
ncbi:hypothetical protein L6164_037405 [Bauhinia variegata]|uniref:Uncharacterized protein n=1 Tax=Bauhinia variegata TaxID=167791 RepID=A0ACB9KJX0_BAUVA|nr:hypothetical protein L6164_037405 [Bauhinia variegata]